MRPGRRAKVECTNIEVDKEKDHLYFHFKSLEKDNPGNMRFTIWKQDTTDPQYKEKMKDYFVNQILHIGSAFVKREKLDAAGGDDWVDFCNGIIKAIGGAYKGVECYGKIVRTVKNGKEYCTFPLFANFLSTDFAPCGFSYDSNYDDFGDETPDELLPEEEAEQEAENSGGEGKLKF